MSPHMLAVADNVAKGHPDQGLKMYRAGWISAQSRLSEIEKRLNAITGEQCGIFDNLELIEEWWAKNGDSEWR